MSEFLAHVRAELDTSGIESQLNALSQGHKIKLDVELNDNFKSTISSLEKSLGKLGSKKINIPNLETQFSKKGTSVGDKFSKSLTDRMRKQVDTNAIGASIAKVEAQYSKLTSLKDSRIFDVRDDIAQLKQLSTVMNDPTKSIQQQTSAFQQYETVLARARNTMTAITYTNKMFADSLQIQNLDNEIEKWLAKNTRAAKDYGESLRNIQSQLRGSGGKMDIGDFNSLKTQVSEIKASATAAGKTGQSMFSQFGKAFASIRNYVGVSTVLYSSISIMKQMFNEVKEIDSAMTELNKVSTASGSQLEQVFENSKVSAREYATTLSDMITATADWSRLGYSLDQSQDLAKVAALYKNVGDNIDISTANEHVISTLQGFQMEASSAESIIDKFNEVSNNYAISSDGIGAALERSASSMSAAGNSLDQTIALVTAANTVVQDPDSVGGHIERADLKNGYIGQYLGVDKTEERFTKIFTKKMLQNITIRRGFYPSKRTKKWIFYRVRVLREVNLSNQNSIQQS